MPRKYTFNAATAMKAGLQVEGYKARLQVGSEFEMFALQIEGGTPCILTHWASGYKLHNLRDIQIERMVMTGDFHSAPRWRAWAQAWLDNRAANFNGGARAMLARMRAAPVINGRTGK